MSNTGYECATEAFRTYQANLQALHNAGRGWLLTNTIRGQFYHLIKDNMASCPISIDIIEFSARSEYGQSPDGVSVVTWERSDYENRNLFWDWVKRLKLEHGIN